MAAGIGQGTALKIWDDISAYFAIAGLDSVTWNRGLETVDATALDSANNGETVIVGIKRWGEVSFEGNWDGSTYQAKLFTDHAARTNQQFQLVWPSTVAAGVDTLTFTGYITSLSVTSPTTDKLRLSGTIKVSASPTLG